MRAPIAHFGTFDVANYGDLLFPLILERRLGDLGPVVHVSPLGGPPPVAGGVTSLAPEALPEELSGVIVGGGHLIHAAPSSLPDYRARPDRALVAYPSLWLGAADRALRAGAPLVWNGPGVPAAFTTRAAKVVAWATSFADHVAVRDSRSRSLLRGAGCEVEIEVVPDTGLEVLHLFDSRALDAAYHEAFAARGLERVGRTLAFHANARYLRDDVPLVAARIERMAEHARATPILLALGACHGDDVLARELAARMRRPALVVDRPRSLCELAACIARSDAYVGSSLHGFITACAFGVRGTIVSREASDGGKFSGFLAPRDLAHWHGRDWEEAEARFPELLAATPEPWARVPRAATPLLERHWTRVRAALIEPPSRPALRASAPARRDSLLRADLDAFGIHTLLLAHQAELTLDQMDQLDRQRQQTAALKASYRAAARLLRKRIAELEPIPSASPNDADRDD